MIVRYSSLNRLEKPKFTLCNPGSVYDSGLLTNMVGMLIDTEAEEIVFNFNATSELHLRVNLIERESPEDNAHVLSIYKAIQNRRLLFVDDIGYFMITNVEDGFDGFKHYKDVKAQSVDIEIAQKKVPYIENGTYKFTNDENGTAEGILETIVETLPLWTIGEVDKTVASKYRTFEDVDTSLNCLNFLLQNIQDAYECIIVFDNIQRTINVYAQDNYVKETEIHITKEDLINSLDIIENADDLYTAVTVLGNDNITISAINPLGTNTIYDFSYYYDWMSDGLGEKVRAWQEAVMLERESYYDLNLMYYKKLAEAASFEMEIDKFNTQITMYTRCRNNIIADASSYKTMVAGYNAVIAENEGTEIPIYPEVADTIQCIDELITECESRRDAVRERLDQTEKSLDAYRTDIQNVHDRLAIMHYFTEEEYTELCHYIYEGSYTDDYVVITDIMTYDEKFEQMKTLFDRAASQLARISKPTQEFSIDVENFIFNKEFARWSEQLETGCLINVELNPNDIALLFLCNITINYDDHTLSLTFGNRFNKFDTKSLFNDVLGKISKSANTISYLKETLYPIKSGELDAMKEALQTSRNLTMAAALASTNEDVVIDGSGYTGRRLTDNGEYDPRQVKLVSNRLVFTDDGWSTSSVALGEIILGDNSTTYGLNAKTLIGEIIVGERLGLANESGNLSFTDNGLEITNGTNTFVVNPNSNKLMSISGNQQDLLTVDDSGTLNITGVIHATGGNIGGCQIIDGKLDGSGLNISANSAITDLSSRLTATADEIILEVKRIQIGSANLLRNSEPTNSVHPWYGANGTAVTVGAIGGRASCLKVDAATSTYGTGHLTQGVGQCSAATYTLSAQIYVEQPCQIFMSFWDDSGDWVTLGTQVCTCDAGWNSVSYTWTLQDGPKSLRAGFSAYKATGVFYVYHPKLEIGDKATSWGPSQSDTIISAINLSPEQITISANKISLEGVVTANNYFKINTDGSVEATGGTIGGFQIDASTLKSGSHNSDNFLGLYSRYPENYTIGNVTSNNWRLIAGKNFGVTREGKLSASDVNITGTITATSGTIGGCTISGGLLQIDGARITSGTIDSARIASLSADKISGGTIDASKINVINLDANNITSGTITANSIAIKDSRRRELLSASGSSVKIAGCTVYYNGLVGGSLSNGTVLAFADTSSGYTIGGVTKTNWRIRSGGNFGVDSDGSMYATAGRVGGWNIYSGYLYGSDSSGRAVQLSPTNCMCGTSDWHEGANWYDIIMAGQAYGNSSSDLNVKNSISDIDHYDIMFDHLQPCRYKYNHGTSGRYHTGFIAQDVVSAIETAGLTTQDFAGVIHLEEPDDNGCEWMLRRDEFVALNTWQIQKLKQRVAELETKLGI